MSDIMEFASREEFRKWLSDHCLSDDGVWLLFARRQSEDSANTFALSERARGVKYPLLWSEQVALLRGI